MRGEIKRLCQRLGATTLYVTHDQAEAMTMADLVAVMREGELQQLAPPDEIYDRPANRFVAAFVGNPPMNVLTARSSTMTASVSRAPRCRSTPARRGACLPAGVAELGIRPEDVQPAEPGSPGRSPARSTWSSRWATRRSSTCASATSALDAARRAADSPRRSARRSASTVDPADACFFDAARSTVVHRAPNKGR